MPEFKEFVQNDTQEFLRNFLSKLAEDMNVASSKNCRPSPKETDLSKLTPEEQGKRHWEISLTNENSIINEIFTGQLRNTLTCTNCSHTSLSFELFSDVSLAFPPAQKNFTPDLRDFINHFLREERIPSFKCTKCRKECPVRKSFAFNRIPPVLVFHLKRFSSRREKINDGITIPLDLNMGSWIPNKRGRKNCYSIILFAHLYIIFIINLSLQM